MSDTRDTERSPADAVRHWVETVVLPLNLCPFAKPVVRAGGVRYVESAAGDLEGLLIDLQAALTELLSAPIEEPATTLLVVPGFLSDFEDYLDTLALIEQGLAEAGLEGEIQVASFHPDYRFADTDDEVTAYTNRTPYPVFHLLREADLEAAIAEHPDVEDVPAQNIARVRALGIGAMRALLARCLRG